MFNIKRYLENYLEDIKKLKEKNIIQKLDVKSWILKIYLVKYLNIIYKNNINVIFKLYK